MFPLLKYFFKKDSGINIHKQPPKTNIQACDHLVYLYSGHLFDHSLLKRNDEILANLW